jgi:hypothetical protein
MYHNKIFALQKAELFFSAIFKRQELLTLTKLFFDFIFTKMLVISRLVNVF